MNMFDLLKDIEKYKGIPPYASELYGVYQPLLGWQSNLTKKWIRHGGPLIDLRIRGILDGRILPGLQEMDEGTDSLFIGLPLEPGRGKSPYTVSLSKDLNSELLELIRVRVQSFVDSHEGRLPEGSEWTTVVDINDLLNTENGSLRKVNDIYRERLMRELQNSELQQGRAEYLAWKRENYFEPMQYESQIATFLLFHAEGQTGYDPNELKKLFTVRISSPLSEILRSTDPLANIDPNDKSGALSPVGLVHLFRQYFFDLGTFLGEPVEHIWLSPGTTIELVEVGTRKVITERSLEAFTESISRSEGGETLKDELSEAVKDENQTSTKLGVSQSGTVDLYVYQGTVSTDFGVESTRKDSREATYKQNREQNEKLSSEIKQNFKSVFRTVTETTDTRSRRHIIQNPSDKLINYELRRKMRRVGVQIQDIGIGLCWQVFIDEPGKDLGLSNLVHIAEPPDLQPQPNQKETPYPPRLVKGFELKPVWLATDDPREPDPGKGYIPLGTFPLPVQPDSGYKLEENQNGRVVNISVKSQHGRDLQGSPFALTGKLVDTTQIEVGVLSPPRGIEWNRNVNFEVVGELAFVPTDDAKKQIDEANEKIRQDGQTAKRDEARLAKEAFLKAAKERIELASEVKPRPSWDLREEERTVVYRELIKRLMLDSWEVSESDEDNLPLSHVRAEIIRSLFDVDRMLYFVAPEWWRQRDHYGQFIGNSPRISLIKGIGKKGFGKTKRPSHGALGNEVITNWSNSEVRPDNYYITDKSQPAKLGSSLGWLLQLDGDNLRNAFLNAPWVKAVIPIRPGREKAALKWLREVAEGDDGWNADYLGVEAEFAGMKMGKVLEIIADRLEQKNGDIQNVLEADEVFEKGFSHLVDGFDAGLEANQVFSQWISILPTDQIVAVEYKPTDLFTQE